MPDAATACLSSDMHQGDHDRRPRQGMVLVAHLLPDTHERVPPHEALPALGVDRGRRRPRGGLEQGGDLGERCRFDGNSDPLACSSHVNMNICGLQCDRS